MSTRSKYPNNKVLIPIMLIIAVAAAVFLMGLEISPVNAVEVANNSIQNNVEVSSSQPSFDNASDYFIFPSQKELFSGLEGVFNSSQQNSTADTPDTATMSPEQRRQLAEEGLKSISSPLERPVMASVKDYSVPGLDGNDIRPGSTILASITSPRLLLSIYLEEDGR